MLVLLPGGGGLRADSLFFDKKIKIGYRFPQWISVPYFLPAEPLGNAGAAIKLFEGKFYL